MLSTWSLCFEEFMPLRFLSISKHEVQKCKLKVLKMQNPLLMSEIINYNDPKAPCLHHEVRRLHLEVRSGPGRRARAHGQREEERRRRRPHRHLEVLLLLNRLLLGFLLVKETSVLEQVRTGLPRSSSAHRLFICSD